MRADSHDGELTLPLPKVSQREGGTARGARPGTVGREHVESADVSDTDSSSEDAPSGDPPSGDDAPPTAAPRRLPSKRLALICAVVVVVLIGTWSVPAVHTVLRQSFTRLPAPYTQLYFTGQPSVNGTTLSVPVTVDGRGTAARSFAVKVWLVNAAGKTDASTTVTLTPKDGVSATVVSLQIPGDAEVVFVNLVGHPETLHYRIAGVPVSVPTAAG